MPSVLIVDDEPAVRDLMARWAASLGLQSRTAADAEQALDAVTTSKPVFAARRSTTRSTGVSSSTTRSSGRGTGALSIGAGM